MTKILGLDLSLSQPGHAIIEIKDGKIKLIETGHIKTSTDMEPAKRLQLIRNYLEHLYLTKQFDYVAREKPPINKYTPDTTEKLCHVAGIAVNVFVGYDIESFSPTTVKLKLTGDGKATKAQVEKGVRQLLNLPDSFKFGTTTNQGDEQDSCAVALAMAMELGLLKPVPKKAKKPKKKKKG